MPIEGVVELRSRGIIPEPLASTHVVGEFAAQIVVEGALGQAREELAR